MSTAGYLTWGYLKSFPFSKGAVTAISILHTIDGSEIPNNHPACTKPCKQWDKVAASTGAGLLPLTVA